MGSKPGSILPNYPVKAPPWEMIFVLGVKGGLFDLNWDQLVAGGLRATQKGLKDKYRKNRMGRKS
jgi:hypothetical protein